MKKYILVIGMLTLSAAAFSQKPANDTLVVDTAKYKVVVIGKHIVSSKEPTFVLKKEHVSAILEMLQEHPAKCANPITEWLLRFFGIKQ